LLKPHCEDAALLGSTQRIHRLTELWIHTGTACNLNCAFCLEGSGPGDTRLERVKLDELKPYFATAVQHGVERFAFTGGEPLIIKDIVKILEHALSLRPCLVLTNGTAPLIKRVHQLEQLRGRAHPLSFRISIDHPDEQRHDAGRGLGNFRKAFTGMKLLHDLGFGVSLARQMTETENSQEITARFRSLLKKYGLPEDTLLTGLPEFGALGQTPCRTQGSIEDSTMGSNLNSTLDSITGGTSQALMCAASRMIVKQGGSLRVYACPLVDDDPRFDLGGDLAEALQRDVPLLHHRCAGCLKYGTQLGGGNYAFGKCAVV